jgi:hypothetical protein
MKEQRRANGAPRELEAIRGSIKAGAPLVPKGEGRTVKPSPKRADPFYHTQGHEQFRWINLALLCGGGSPVEYRDGLERAMAKDWLWRHESGTYVKFTPARADLFAELLYPE